MNGAFTFFGNESIKDPFFSQYAPFVKSTLLQTLLFTLLKLLNHLPVIKQLLQFQNALVGEQYIQFKFLYSNQFCMEAFKINWRTTNKLFKYHLATKLFLERPQHIRKWYSF